MIRKNIEINNFADRIEAVNKAISNRQEVILNVEKNDSEEIHTSAYWYDTAPKRMVPRVTLTELFAEHHLDRVDLLKIDCEGEECFSCNNDHAFPVPSPENLPNRLL